MSQSWYKNHSIFNSRYNFFWWLKNFRIIGRVTLIKTDFVTHFGVPSEYGSVIHALFNIGFYYWWFWYHNPIKGDFFFHIDIKYHREFFLERRDWITGWIKWQWYFKSSTTIETPITNTLHPYCKVRLIKKITRNLKIWL